jgi:hypothetical protein
MRRSTGPMNDAPEHEGKERRPCASWMRPVRIHLNEVCFANGLGFWAAGFVLSALVALVGVEGYGVVSARRPPCPPSTDTVPIDLVRIALASLAPSEVVAADAAAPIIDDADAMDESLDAVSVSRVDPHLCE